VIEFPGEMDSNYSKTIERKREIKHPKGGM
jgi:hypothetical protein